MKNYILLNQKTFVMKDQKDFANLSGDYNPIHLDHIEARKSIVGHIIVHGINTFLWAIECLVEKEKVTYSNFKINFLHPIALRHTVELYWNKAAKELKIKDKKGLVYCSIKLLGERKSFKSIPIQVSKTIFKKPLKLSPQDLLSKNILIRFNNGNKRFLKSLYPYLYNKLGIDIVFEIAGLSSVVGMNVPGLKSLFLGLDLEIRKKNIEQKVKILKQNNLGMMSLQYNGKNIASKIQACFRPDSIQAVSCINIKKKIKSKFNFKGKKVLVIGGSRGIGAVVAKIVSIYGAKVILTYYKGLKEAKIVDKDIKSFGGSSIIKRLDITSNKSIEQLKGFFDQIYYFPTPKIIKNTSSIYDKNLKNKYLLYYVDGFRKIIKQFYKNNKKTKIMYPSTSFIDNRNYGFSEYVDAKIKGELVALEFISKNSLKIYMPRVPPVLTDQNLSLMPKKYDDIVLVANDLISLMIDT